VGARVALSGRRLPRRPELHTLVWHLAPAFLRRWWRRRHPHRTELPTWLTEQAVRLVNALLAEEGQSQPLSAAAEVKWWWRQRWTQMGIETLSLIASDTGCLLSAPFAHPLFVASLARASGFRGFPDRTALTHQLFGDTIPPSVVSRSTKATFDPVFWDSRVRGFAQKWDGVGIDHGLADRDEIRRRWLWEAGREVPSFLFQSALPLHAAWLSHPQLLENA
jgi:hypothetical protein